MKLTTLIIDDSKMQQLLTRKFVNEHPDLDCLGTYGDPKMGLKVANILKPDVIILDVEMPGFSGFEVLEQLNHDCQVILYSTRPEFALKAFKFDQVADFMTKPMQKSRFDQSIFQLHARQSNTAPRRLTVAKYPQPERLSLAS